MKSNDVRILVKNMRNTGRSYGEIAGILHISRQSVRNLCNYKLNAVKKKRGPKLKINRFTSYLIQREVANIKCSGKKVTTTKIISNCNLNISQSTCWRSLNRNGFKCRKARQQILLTKAHKEARINLITEWLTKCHNWDLTVFSDEKRFSLDGPDSWYTYVKGTDTNIRQIRQCEGGGILVWAMVMPNGLISHQFIRGKFKATDYLTLLKEKVIPILKLNFGDNFWFQEDNASVHKAKIIKDFYTASGINVLKWPAKSPDINITEDIWRIISEMVYDGPQYRNKIELERAINDAIFTINTTKRQCVFDLYHRVIPRLINILRKNGNLCNK